MPLSQQAAVVMKLSASSYSTTARRDGALPSLVLKQQHRGTYCYCEDANSYKVSYSSDSYAPPELFCAYTMFLRGSRASATNDFGAPAPRPLSSCRNVGRYAVPGCELLLIF
jgi:hypothetical protein